MWHSIPCMGEKECRWEGVRDLRLDESNGQREEDAVKDLPSTLSFSSATRDCEDGAENMEGTNTAKKKFVFSTNSAYMTITGKLSLF